MFKTNQIILYPNHGVGKIGSITVLDESNTNYYNIDFVNSNVSVSLPVENAENLGLVKLPSKKKVLEELANLGKKVVINENLAKDIRTITTKDLNTTNLSKVVDLVNTIEAYDKYNGKSLEIELYNVLEMSKGFIRSVVIETLGKSSLSKFPDISIAQT